MERAYTEDGYANRIQPSTLEGNVVRVADIIAYLGKDRQDAARVKMTAEDAYAEHEIGSLNAEIINNLVVNIIENSYGKPYIKLYTVHFEALPCAHMFHVAQVADVVVSVLYCIVVVYRYQFVLFHSCFFILSL